MFSKDDIIRYADKLLIGLSKEEAETIYDEFSLIDKNIDQINEINGLNEVEPMFMPYDLYLATLRDDKAEESVDVDEILSNAKDKEGREIRVPKVVE